MAYIKRLNDELLDTINHPGNVETDEVKRLLEQGASGRARCRLSGTSAVHIAASQGDTASLGHLLQHGGDARAKDRKGRQPAHLAAWNNQLHVLEILVKTNPGLINCNIIKDEYAEGDQDILDTEFHNHQSLYEPIPADVNLEDGLTPLHLACMRGHYELVTFLLNRGANVDELSTNFATPIDVAGLYLAEAEASAEGEIEEGTSLQSPLSEPEEQMKKEAKTKQMMMIYEVLLEHGATLPQGSPSTTKKKTTPLHIAVSRGNLEIIRFLLYKGANLTAWNGSNETALHLAIREKLFEPLKTMLDWDADQLANPGLHWKSKIDARDWQGRTPLLLAAELTWPEAVTLLLEKGADLSATNKRGWNFLMYNATRANDKMMKEFLTKMRETLTDSECCKIIDHRDEWNNKAATYAATRGGQACLVLLNKHRAEVTRHQGSQTTGHVGAWSNFRTQLRGWMGLLRGLGSPRDDVNGDDGFGDQRQSDSQASLRMSDKKAAEGRNRSLNAKLLDAVNQTGSAETDRVKRLLEQGASGRARCRLSGTSAVHIAASRGDTASLGHLLQHGGDARAKDRKGRQPAHLAAWNNQLHVLEILIKTNPGLINCNIIKDDYPEDDQDILDTETHNHQSLGELGIPADVDLEDGLTPLHLACMRGHYELVKFLLNRSANVDELSTNFVTPVDVAGLYLAEAEASPEGIIKEGTSPHSPMSEPAEPMTKEAKMKQMMKIYEVLLEHGAMLPQGRPSAMSESSNSPSKKTTPLHTSVVNGNLEIIRFLLDKGASLKAWNGSNETALHLAIREKLFEPLKTMLDWDADQLANPGLHWESNIDARDRQGRTPLLLAAELTWPEAVTLLLEKGADLSATNKGGSNFLMYNATRANDKMMKEFLTKMRETLTDSECCKIIDHRDEWENKAATYAATHGGQACLVLLNEHFADVTREMIVLTSDEESDVLPSDEQSE